MTGQDKMKFQISNFKYQINYKTQVPKLKFGIWILFVICFLKFGIFYAQAAILYSQAANQDVYEGQTFVLEWFLDTEGKPINSLDLKLDFTPDTLEVVETTTGNSLVNLWIRTPTTDNNKGTLSLTGGIANGINSKQLPIFRSVFQAKKPGTASIKFNPDSTVLLNDGLGTQETLKFKDEVFNIYPKEFIPTVISSTTHPDPNTWYRNREVQIKFTPKEGVDYSYSFSSNLDIIPDDQKMDVPETITYSNMPDGIYYFKLNSKVGPSAWQEAGVFRVEIDATSPEAFTPIISSDPSIFDGKAFLSFSTVDKTSGISHYKVKVGLFGKEIETQSPYQLRKPLVGNNVEVTAYDNAGNERIETVDWPGVISVGLLKLILILTGILAVIINWIVGRQIKKTNAKK